MGNVYGYIERKKKNNKECLESEGKIWHIVKGLWAHIVKGTEYGIRQSDFWMMNWYKVGKKTCTQQRNICEQMENAQTMIQMV